MKWEVVAILYRCASWAVNGYTTAGRAVFRTDHPAERPKPFRVFFAQSGQ